MINKIKAYVKNPSDLNINALEARSASSFVVLEKIDSIIDAFVKTHNDNEAEVLLKVYGLLQSLFVSIDAMYDLAIGLTNYKYHLNINSNKALHELKYIRNDVVGHPTNRTYNNTATGFAVIDYRDILITQISYKIFIFNNTKQTTSIRTIYFDDLIKNFKHEKSIFLNDLYYYLTNNIIDTALLDLTASFFDHPSNQTLDKIESEFNILNPNTSENHRFLWRTKLLRLALSWQEDNKLYQELINYIIKVQAKKLNQIQSDLNKVKSNLPYVKIPTILSKVYKYFKKHANLVNYINNLHDYYHPSFQSDLNYILVKVKNSADIHAFFTWFSHLENEEKTYLVGSLIKAYRK